MQAGSKIKLFEENFGNRFYARFESISFRLQAPIDGDKGPLGQVCCSSIVMFMIFVKFLNISLWLQVEPYFITLALYDLKLNKKISEDFHSDANHPLLKAAIQSMQPNSNEPNTVDDIPRDWLAFPKQVRVLFLLSISNYCHCACLLIAYV